MPSSEDKTIALRLKEAGKLMGIEVLDHVIIIRQAFKPGEITPEEANRIGYELALSWTKQNYPFIVCTHTDKAHIHYHKAPFPLSIQRNSRP